MIEKRIRHFYNSVQISGDISPVCAVQMKLLHLVSHAVMGLAAAVLVAKGIMYLVEWAGSRAAARGARKQKKAVQ